MKQIRHKTPGGKSDLNNKLKISTFDESYQISKILL